MECVKNHTCGWTVFLTCVGDMVVCNQALAEKQLQVEDSGRCCKTEKVGESPHGNIGVCVYVSAYIL